MTDAPAPPPETGWLCTDAGPDFAIHLTRPGTVPITFRPARDTELRGLVLRRHQGSAEQLLVLTYGQSHQIAKGIWLTAGGRARTVCIHAIPEVRTARRWHYLNLES